MRGDTVAIEVGAATDFDLLERWRAGTKSAGDTLVRRHYDSVWRFFELKAAYVADDLTQQVFVAAVEGRDRFRSSATFKAYLFGIARRQLLSHLRKLQRGETAMRKWQAHPGETGATPSKLVAMAQAQRLLVLALEALPPDLQIATMLHYWEGMRGAEIAEVLEIPVSTVRNRLARARDAVRDRVHSLSPPKPLRDALEADFDAWAQGLAGAPLPAKPGKS